MTEEEQREIDEAYGYLRIWSPQLRLDHMDFEIVLANPEELNAKLGMCKVAPAHHRQKRRIPGPGQSNTTQKGAGIRESVNRQKNGRRGPVCFFSPFS